MHETWIAFRRKQLRATMAGIGKHKLLSPLKIRWNISIASAAATGP
jgi:hypothetical protein